MIQKKLKDRARRAFTLVELLVVIGIIILVAGISAVAVAPLMRGASLRSGARIVQAMIYEGRSYASAHHTKASVLFDVDTGCVSVHETAEPSRDNRIDQPGCLPRGVRFMDNPPVTGGAVPDYKLVFTSRGSIDPLGGTGNRKIRLTDERGGTVKVIEVIFASGLVKVYDE